MDENREFYTLHLPHLFGYVVPVLNAKKGDACPAIGSGVLVNVSGRHFVATARHCIKDDVRVGRSIAPLQREGTIGMRPLHIIDRGWHDTLDLGYLEIQDPEVAELHWDQLCNDQIVSGLVHVVGYPEELVKLVETVPGKSVDVSLAAGIFSTSLDKETDDRMTFGYPKIGMKYDEAKEIWSESAFPKTPKGFSGGACFGVAEPPGNITQVQYKLLAIQYAWNERDSVFAVPIKRWCELLTERGLV